VQDDASPLTRVVDLGQGVLQDAIRQPLALIGEVPVEGKLEVGATIHGATSSAASTDRESASSAARIARWA
jgi:hypothetical protein